MRVALVVNPTSGRHHGDRVAAAARARLAREGHAVTLVRGSDASSASRGVERELVAGLDLLVVVGGDGALHHLLPLVLDHGVTVGLLPAGTGNDTARALGIPVKDEAAALDVLLAGSTRLIDVATTPAGPVVTVVASGFDSRVNERANAMRWPRGNMRYNLAILAELRSFTPIPFSITLDGPDHDDVTLDRDVMLVAVGNGPSFGGGLRICEGADLSDGLLDVVVVNPVSKPKLLRVFPELYRGTHLRRPEVEVHRVRSVELVADDVVAYGDGERLGPLPIRVAVEPGALRVVAPDPGARP